MEQNPDFDPVLPMETTPSQGGERRRLAARHRKNTSSSWTKTDIRYTEHSHDWLVRGFSQTDARYLETTFSVKDEVNINFINI